MHTIDESPLGESFIYSRRIPVAFEALNAPLSASELIDVNAKNQHLLNMISILEGHRSDSDEDDEAIFQEVKRVEMKVDLLLLMMNKLMRENNDFPEEVALKLSAHGATFASDVLNICQYQQGTLHLYLHPMVSDPIVFSVLVERLNDQQLCLRFQGINDVMNDAFEKYIFRQHRREIAGARGL
ncbi:MAG: PilZ domain-containing protein [Pseudomonadales bacterium]|nr:PilZ domain-containing protein [Pseudomonadales bacterium]